MSVAFILEFLLRDDILDLRLGVDDVVGGRERVQRFIVLGIRRRVHVASLDDVEHLQLQLHVLLRHHADEYPDVVRRPNLIKTKVSLIAEQWVGSRSAAPVERGLDERTNWSSACRRGRRSRTARAWFAAPPWSCPAWNPPAAVNEKLLELSRLKTSQSLLTKCLYSSWIFWYSSLVSSAFSFGSKTVAWKFDIRRQRVCLPPPQIKTEKALTDGFLFDERLQRSVPNRSVQETNKWIEHPRVLILRHCAFQNFQLLLLTMKFSDCFSIRNEAPCKSNKFTKAIGNDFEAQIRECCVLVESPWKCKFV